MYIYMIDIHSAISNQRFVHQKVLIQHGILAQMRRVHRKECAKMGCKATDFDTIFDENDSQEIKHAKSELFQKATGGTESAKEAAISY